MPSELESRVAAVVVPALPLAVVALGLGEPAFAALWRDHGVALAGAAWVVVGGVSLACGRGREAFGTGVFALAALALVAPQTLPGAWLCPAGLALQGVLPERGPRSWARAGGLLALAAAVGLCGSAAPAAVPEAALALSALVLGAVFLVDPGPVRGAHLAAWFGLWWGAEAPPHERLAWLCAGVLALGVGLAQETYRLAYRDGLTGLPSRRALDAACSRLGSRYAVVMVDVDHFKRFNDRFGHGVGDQVLRLLAARLGRVGGGGEAFRYGGEEFAVLFPNRASREAAERVDAVRDGVAKAGFALRAADRPKRRPQRTRGNPARRVKVTFSAGVAEATPARSDPEAVRRAADKALYAAKRQGRNRVVLG